MMQPSVEPAGPRPLPLVGNALPFLLDKSGFLLRCAAKYGPIVRLRIGRPTYLLNDPDDIKYVLETNHSNYDKTPRLTSPRGRRLSGKGVLTSSGQEHLEQRALLQPFFHRNAIAGFAERIVGSVEAMVSGWQDGVEMDLAAEMMNLAMQITGKTLFSIDLRENARRLGDDVAMRRRYLHYMFASLSPRPEWMPNRINWQYRRAIRRLDAAIFSMIRERRNSPESHGDFLEMLLRAHYKDGRGMDDKLVRDEALMLSVTGYETVGEALAWTLYLLIQHPEIEAKLRKEIHDVLGNRAPVANDVPDLRYTEMVAAESMRLYPPTWIYVRIARRGDTLPSRVTIAARSKLYLCPLVTHRNPRYFPEPERFDPERFDKTASANRPKFAYFPFGGGPRICIGQAFAKMEIALALACIVRRFRFRLVPGQKIVPQTAITLRPKNGIRVLPEKVESFESERQRFA